MRHYLSLKAFPHPKKTEERASRAKDIVMPQYHPETVIQVNPSPVLRSTGGLKGLTGDFSPNAPAGAHRDWTLTPLRRGDPSPLVKVHPAVGPLRLY